MLVASAAGAGPVVGQFGAGTAHELGVIATPRFFVVLGCCLGGKRFYLCFLVVSYVLLWGGLVLCRQRFWAEDPPRVAVGEALLWSCLRAASHHTIGVSSLHWRCCGFWPWPG